MSGFGHSNDILGLDLSKDATLASPPGDTISSLSWSSKADYLGVGSWDHKVRIYDMTSVATGEGRAMIDFDGPVLSCDWSVDGSKIAGAGADKTARLLDLGMTGAPAQQVAAHEMPIKSVRFFEAPNSNAPMIVTGSWDRTIKYWDLRTAAAVATVDCKERVYSMDVNKDVLVVGTASQDLHIIDLKNPGFIAETRDSPLKYQTRVVACSRDAKAFVVGGIDGRVTYQAVSPSEASKCFSFRCHRREDAKTYRSTTNVYAVNDVSPHPIHEAVFATAGSDGMFNIWDMASKSRLKASPSVGGPITATAFNSNGSRWAYAVGYDWSKGYAFNRDVENKVLVHHFAPDVIKPKVPKK